MHYKCQGMIVRSENAAKPVSQASGYVIKLLKKIGPFSHALDYGGGKLRYAVQLAKLAKRLTVVDSEIQLSRTQVICGQVTTVRDYVAAEWTHAAAVNDSDFKHVNSRFDFILCANVLSTIPSARTRMAIIRGLANRLTRNGRCLFICQYTNSYFCTQMADKAVKKYADGFIKVRNGNASFYGLIKPPVLNRMIVKAGMKIQEAWINDQSGYVLATRRSQ